MDVSVTWISDMLGQEIDPQDAADRLARAVAPVDAVEPMGDELSDVVVAIVEEVSRHPAADRLTLCKVNAGHGLVDVICGAPNVKAGKKYPYAPVGAVLPGDVKIKKRKIRGVASSGMLCSERELELGPDQEGIMELDVADAPGSNLRDALGLSDFRLDVDVTPDRPDMLCHKGIARELGASYGLNLRLIAIPGVPESTLAPVRAPTSGDVGGVTVSIQDREGCPRYMAAVIKDVRIGASPGWLKSRVRRMGTRPINNVVDATNYILFELNQPLHAFDLDRVGKRVVVRKAGKGETITTLDGESRELNPTMTMICDASGPIAIGGVIGGVDTEVTEKTTNILLECAYFDPKTIRATRKTLKISTEASYRFERGTDIQGMSDALRRAVGLIMAVAGGSEAGPPVDVYPNPVKHANVFLRPERVNHLLGVDVPRSEIEGYLTSVGFIVAPKGDRLAVQVPGWRPDVTREVDLIEEVARLRGYDSFPSEMRPFRPGTVDNDRIEDVKTRIRSVLSSIGLHEARGSSFSSGGTLTPEAQPVLNPLSVEEAYLRTDLISGLIRSVEYNWSVRERDVRLFEIGIVFHKRGDQDLPQESLRVAGVVTGARSGPHWSESGKSSDYDLWDAKFAVEQVVRVMGKGVIEAAGSGWHVKDGGMAIGWARKLSAERPDWVAEIVGFEVELENVEMWEPHFAPVPTTPPLERDLALVLPDGVTAADVEALMRDAAGSLLESVVIFDEYRSKEFSGRSVAWHLVFRVPNRTLRDKDADQALGHILKSLKKNLNVELRHA
ncbi:MAG: phenylalanine--tRNA ligase subunit beta [Gemmatimonadales bacterium]